MSSENSPNRTWAVGQKVLCIDDAFPRHIAEWCDTLPAVGEVYTIRAMQLGGEPSTGRCDVGFLLVEISNPRKASGAEAGFFHTRFEPWLDAESVSSSATERVELSCKQ